MKRDKLEREILKSRLSQAYAEIEEGELRAEIVRRYAQLRGEADLSNAMLAKHLLRSILPAAAIYGQLLERGRDGAEALARIRASVMKSDAPMRGFLSRAGRLPGFYRLFRRMCVAGTKTAFGPAGWVFEWKRRDDAVLAWNCRRCFYVEAFARLRLPELTEIFCASDDFIYGAIPGLRWARTKTLGRGDALCNFCFIREKRVRAGRGKAPPRT